MGSFKLIKNEVKILWKVFVSKALKDLIQRCVLIFEANLQRFYFCLQKQEASKDRNWTLFSMS